MKIRLFGKDLFEFNLRGGDFYARPAMGTVEKSKFLPDFRASVSNWGSDVVQSINNWVVQGDAGPGTNIKTIPIQNTPKKERKKLTPKKVYSLKMLHDQEFKVNMDPKYVEEQVIAFKEKLGLIKNPQYDHRGYEEIGSILIRMQNRKKYESGRAVFEKFPYTTNKRIESVLKKHDYLQIGEVSQFVADMPKEATDAMNEYNSATQKLCDKKAVFYIIADKKDFQKTNSRRDPILLAQSPFGHFWQILGAWDDEMLFLDEL